MMKGFKKCRNMSYDLPSLILLVEKTFKQFLLNQIKDVSNKFHFEKFHLPPGAKITTRNKKIERAKVF